MSSVGARKLEQELVNESRFAQAHVVQVPTPFPTELYLGAVR